MMDIEQIRFRQYQDADIEQVKTLHEVALRSTNAFSESGIWDSDLNDIRTHYINNGGNFLVGVIDEEIVAMGAFRRISKTTAELKRGRVRPDLQGRGIGRKLLSLREAEIQAMGYSVIQLDTTVNQPAAQHLYKSSGYIEFRREKGWPLETIFYRKVLDSSLIEQ